MTATWSSGAGNWRFSLDAAPGVQQVGNGGRTSATIRAGGRLAYSVAPGREIGLATLFSTTGLTTFASGGDDYRYLSLRLSVSWAIY